MNAFIAHHISRDFDSQREPIDFSTITAYDLMVPIVILTLSIMVLALMYSDSKRGLM